MPAQKEQAPDKNDPLAYTRSPDWNPAKFKDAGQATVDGKKCRVLEALAEGKGVKFYVWEEYGFPLKVEYYENGKPADAMEYKNVAVNNVPDSVFDLPAGVQIQGVNLPNVPGAAPPPRQP